MESTESLPLGPFSGPVEFAGVIRQAMLCAASEGWREMVWSDATFEAWPLYEKAVVEGLEAWSQKGRKLTLLAHRFDAMRQVHHRFVAWRVRWDHLVECRVCRDMEASDFPSALWTPNWAMHRLDSVRSHGSCSVEPRMRLMLREKLDECRRQSAPGFPATVLGL
jgi:hypothetical protein